DAFLSHDGGDSWHMIHRSQLHGNVYCRPVFDPLDPKTIYAAGGWEGRLKVSHDGGEHWVDLGDLPEGLRELAVDQDHPDLMLAGIEDKTFVSADKGEHWREAQGIRGIVAGFFIDRTSAKDQRACLALTTRGLFQSRDSGKTWSVRGKGLPLELLPKNIAEGAGAPGLCGASDPKTGQCVIYAVFPSREQKGKVVGGVYRSLDRGETWETAMGQGINLDTHAFDEWAEGPVAQY